MRSYRPIFFGISLPVYANRLPDTGFRRPAKMAKMALAGQVENGDNSGSAVVIGQHRRG